MLKEQTYHNVNKETDSNFDFALSIQGSLWAYEHID